MLGFVLSVLQFAVKSSKSSVKNTKNTHNFKY